MANVNFYETIYTYGSPVIATLVCLLNLPEIILLVRRYRKIAKTRCDRRAVPVILLISLAASDLLVGLTVILVKVLGYLIIKQIIPNDLTSYQVSKVLKFLFLRLSLLTSVFNLLALTLDRFLAIRKPLIYRTRIHTKHGVVAVIVTWVSSTLIIGIHYYFSVYGEIEELKYRLLIFPITVIPACIAFSIMYMMILRSVCKQGRRAMQGSATGAKHYQRYLLERELKVSRFSATVVCMFMVCWLPLGIIGLISIVGVDFESTLPNLMFFLSFLNSAINPLIYFAFKENACRQIKRFCSFVCAEQQSEVAVHQSRVNYCQSGVARRQSGVENHQSRDAKYQSENAYCQSKNAYCQSKNPNCQSVGAKCQSEDASCQSEDDNSPSENDYCQSKNPNCQSEDAKCQTFKGKQP